jgi:hypothetical protein
MVAGFLIPVITDSISYYFATIKPFPLNSDLKLEAISIIFEPFSIMGIDSTAGAIASIIINIILYGAIGIFLWFIIYREKNLFLIPLAGLIGLIIYWFHIINISQLFRSF